MSYPPLAYFRVELNISSCTGWSENRSKPGLTSPICRIALFTLLTTLVLFCVYCLKSIRLPVPPNDSVVTLATVNLCLLRFKIADDSNLARKQPKLNLELEVPE